jgi:hypothetical protein
MHLRAIEVDFPDTEETSSEAGGRMAEIHDAVRAKDLNQVRALLEADSSLVDLPDKDGYRPLQIAIWYNDSAMVKLLIGLGADTKRRGPAGLLPVEVAMARNSDEIVAILGGAPKAKIRVEKYASAMPYLIPLVAASLASVVLNDITSLQLKVRISVSLLALTLIMLWVYRANKNTHALFPGKPTYSPWLAAWSFIIPVFCVYGPYQAVEEMWELCVKPSDLKGGKRLSSQFVKEWWVLGLLEVFVQLGVSEWRDPVARHYGIIVGAIIYSVYVLQLIIIAVVITKRQELMHESWESSAGIFS